MRLSGCERTATAVVSVMILLYGGLRVAEAFGHQRQAAARLARSG
jgi:hypothetical protein